MLGAQRAPCGLGRDVDHKSQSAARTRPAMPSPRPAVTASRFQRNDSSNGMPKIAIQRNCRRKVHQSSWPPQTPFGVVMKRAHARASRRSARRRGPAPTSPKISIATRPTHRRSRAGSRHGGGCRGRDRSAPRRHRRASGESPVSMMKAADAEGAVGQPVQRSQHPGDRDRRGAVDDQRVVEAATRSQPVAPAARIGAAAPDPLLETTAPAG